MMWLAIVLALLCVWLSCGVVWLDSKYLLVSKECDRLEDANWRLRRACDDLIKDVRVLKEEKRDNLLHYENVVNAYKSRLSEIKEKLGQFVCEAVALEYQLFPESEGDKDNVPF